jgi:hypothetical protein
MIVAAMEITAMPPTMPPAMSPTFELPPLCEGSGEEVDKEVAEVGAGDVKITVAPPASVVLEELGLPISAPESNSGVSENDIGVCAMGQRKDRNANSYHR